MGGSMVSFVPVRGDHEQWPPDAAEACVFGVKIEMMFLRLPYGRGTYFGSSLRNVERFFANSTRCCISSCNCIILAFGHAVLFYACHISLVSDESALIFASVGTL